MLFLCSTGRSGDKNLFMLCFLQVWFDFTAEEEATEPQKPQGAGQGTLQERGEGEGQDSPADGVTQNVGPEGDNTGDQEAKDRDAAGLLNSVSVGRGGGRGVKGRAGQPCRRGGPERGARRG